MDQELYRERLHKVIPGGAHTYSRGDDQFPSNAPAIFEKGQGCYLWDSDGREFIDYGMGLRSVNIGYGNKEIADACYNEILKGNNLTRASITELKAAELLVDLIPGADMVKFAKHGSTVTSAAVKLARAYTGREYIAIPKEQPFFSFDDWFIGSTVMNKGVLEEVKKYAINFSYNNIDSLKSLFETHKGKIAAVMLEPATHILPTNEFLNQVKDLCKKEGAVFILDEMITGFRWHLQGAQTYYNVQPDLCTFGKGMANGFAVAALAGKKEIMELGGINKPGAERVFLTSTTHGAEMGSLGAFIKTVEILKRENVIDHIWKYGNNLLDGIKSITKSLGIDDYFYTQGAACSPLYVTCGTDKLPNLGFRTLFIQEMIKNNVLFPYIALSHSHGDKELEITLNAIEASLNVYRMALEEGLVPYLNSEIIKPVFRKYN